MRADAIALGERAMLLHGEMEYSNCAHSMRELQRKQKKFTGSRRQLERDVVRALVEAVERQAAEAAATEEMEAMEASRDEVDASDHRDADEPDMPRGERGGDASSCSDCVSNTAAAGDPLSDASSYPGDGWPNISFDNDADAASAGRVEPADARETDKPEDDIDPADPAEDAEDGGVCNAEEPVDETAADTAASQADEPHDDGVELPWMKRKRKASEGAERKGAKKTKATNADVMMAIRAHNIASVEALVAHAFDSDDTALLDFIGAKTDASLQRLITRSRPPQSGPPAAPAAPKCAAGPACPAAAAARAASGVTASSAPVLEGAHDPGGAEVTLADDKAKPEGDDRAGALQKLADDYNEDALKDAIVGAEDVGAGEGVVKAPSEDTIDDSAVLRRLTLARLRFGRDLAASSANGQQPLKYRECILSVQCGWFAFFSSASDPRACATERCRKSLATDARHLRAIYRFKRGMRRSTRSKERRGWCTSSRSRRGEKPARTGVHLCN